MNLSDGLINTMGWWGMFIGVVLATYIWRGLGVLLAGHISQNSEIFRWLSCVTYAMVGALTVKLILFPTGLLMQVPISFRVSVCIGCVALNLFLRMSLMQSLLFGSALMAGFGLYLQYQHFFSI